MNFNEFIENEVTNNIEKLSLDTDIQALSRIWLREATLHKYSHNYKWLGRPIIQIPQDVFAMQEIIWTVKPDLIIETGIAHGGSLIFSASMLALLDLDESIKTGRTLNPSESKRKVLGIDIEIRPHNRKAIETHAMFSRIKMIESSSIACDVIDQVWEVASHYERILVCLDSMHTHEHVFAELEAYAPLVSVGSYCVVFDTAIENMPDKIFHDRPWSKGNNPKTAVLEYLRLIEREGRSAKDGDALHFKIDKTIETKLLITVASGGYLFRI